MKKQYIYAIIALLLVFAAFTGASFWAGTANYAYQELEHAFIGHSQWINSMVWQVGGCAQLAAAWITQHFSHPWAAAFLNAALLTFIFAMAWAMAKRWSLLAICLLPSIALFYVQYNVYWQWSGTVALATCALALWLTQLARADWRIFLAVTLTVALWATCGAIAILYAACVAVAEMISNPRRKCLYLICVLIAFFLAGMQVRHGTALDLARAITPMAYYMPRMHAPAILWLPWVLLATVVWIGRGCKHAGLRSSRAQLAMLGIGIAVCAGLAVYMHRGTYDQRNELFKELYVDVANRNWQGIIEKCQNKSLNNLLLQNCWNLALAETGQLGERLMQQPCLDIRSIYLPEEKIPYNYFLLSHIYYSMGHVALAQRYAFEANQVLGGYSPRMLQMLVRTNLITGQYAVAQKYIDLLTHTSGYRDWAREMQRFVDDDEAVMADPELGLRRRGLAANNKFAGLGGLDQDLRAILDVAPDNVTTRDYLCALYLLSANGDGFMHTVDSTTVRLPKVYAEGVAAFAPDSIARLYGVDQALIDEYQQYKKAPKAMPGSYWDFLRRY